MHAMLCREIERLCREWWPTYAGRLSPRRAKRDFRVGATTTVAKRLHDARINANTDARRAGQDQALVRIDQRRDAVMRFVESCNISARKPTHHARASGAHAAGRRAGERVHLGGGGTRIGSGPRRLN